MTTADNSSDVLSLQLRTHFDPDSEVCQNLNQLPNKFLSVPQWSKPYFLNMIKFLQVRPPGPSAALPGTAASDKTWQSRACLPAPLRACPACLPARNAFVFDVHGIASCCRWQAVVKPANAKESLMKKLLDFQEELWTTGRIGQLIDSGNGGLRKSKKMPAQ
jgi:hypothetical protein